MNFILLQHQVTLESEILDEGSGASAEGGIIFAKFLKISTNEKALKR